MNNNVIQVTLIPEIPRESVLFYMKLELEQHRSMQRFLYITSMFINVISMFLQLYLKQFF